MDRSIGYAGRISLRPPASQRLLGTRQNGRWLLAPQGGCRKVTRRYRDQTLILETRFETASGVLLLTDFMPVRETHSDVVRIVRCLEGKVTVQMELCVRFDYGRTIPWTGPRDGNAWAAAAGSGVVYLRTQQPIRTNDEIATAEFTLSQGEQRSFVLTHVQAQEPPPRRINVQKALRQTEQFWRRWCAINSYDGAWRDAVERSLITLKALTYRPSGGIVAAPTTSLPERVGGDRNWDYRYCWLRDAAFTLESLLSVGYHDEARAWQEWLASGRRQRRARPADHVWHAWGTASSGMRASLAEGYRRSSPSDRKCGIGAAPARCVRRSRRRHHEYDARWHPS